MDKKNDCNSSQEESGKMPALAKTEQSYKRLSLSTKKLNDITVKPKVKNEKVLLDKNKKDHRYIMDEEF